MRITERVCEGCSEGRCGKKRGSVKDEARVAAENGGSVKDVVRVAAEN